MLNDDEINKEIEKAIERYAKKEAQKMYSFSKALKWFTIGFCTCKIIFSIVELF